MKRQQLFTTNKRIIIGLISFVVLAIGVATFYLTKTKQQLTKNALITAYTKDFVELKDNSKNIDTLFLYSSSSESVLYILNFNNEIIGTKKFDIAYTNIIYRELNTFIIVNDSNVVEISFKNKEIIENEKTVLSDEETDQLIFQKNNTLFTQIMPKNVVINKPISARLTLIYDNFNKEIQTLNLNNRTYVLMDFDRNSIMRDATSIDK